MNWEPQGPCSKLPLLPPSVVAARLEDPGFAEVLGRARAKARREQYDAGIHYPWAPPGAEPERQREHKPLPVNNMTPAPALPKAQKPKAPPPEPASPEPFTRRHLRVL